MIFHPPTYQPLQRQTLHGKRYYVLTNENETSSKTLVRFPSVTTILSIIPKPALDKWKERVGPEQAHAISQRAVRRGSVMHLLFESYFSQYAESDTQRLARAQAQYSILRQQARFDEKELQIGKDLFYAWYLKTQDRDVYALGTEVHVYSHTYGGYAGTADLIIQRPGDDFLTLVDLKTSRKKKKAQHITSYFMQAAAYRNAYQEMYQLPIGRIEIWVMCEQDEEVQRFILHRRAMQTAETYFGKVCQAFHARHHLKSSTE